MMCSGGYMTAWSEYPRFKPDDGENVIIHWNGHFVDVAIYSKEHEIFVIAEDLFHTDNVDYWMRIPPIPKE